MPLPTRGVPPPAAAAPPAAEGLTEAILCRLEEALSFFSYCSEIAMVLARIGVHPTAGFEPVFWALEADRWLGVAEEYCIIGVTDTGVRFASADLHSGGGKRYSLGQWTKARSCAAKSQQEMGGRGEPREGESGALGRRGGMGGDLVVARCRGMEDFGSGVTPIVKRPLRGICCRSWSPGRVDGGRGV